MGLLHVLCWDGFRIGSTSSMLPPVQTVEVESQVRSLDTAILHSYVLVLESLNRSTIIPHITCLPLDCRMCLFVRIIGFKTIGLIMGWFIQSILGASGRLSRLTSIYLLGCSVRKRLAPGCLHTRYRNSAYAGRGSVSTRRCRHSPRF